MKKTVIPPQLLLFTLCLTVLSTSCSRSSNTEGAVESRTINSSKPTISDAQKLSSSATPISTPSLIPETSPAVLGIPAALPTPSKTKIPNQTTTPIPSDLPIPTLSRSEAEILVVEMLETVPKCELPCWWNFIPGQTSWDKAELFLETVASRIGETGLDERVNYSVFLPVPEHINFRKSIVHEYRVENGIIEMIEIDIGKIFRPSTPFTLSEFLTEHGHPQEIWINTYQFQREVLPFRLALYYPLKGVMIQYYVDAAIVDGVVRACPNESVYNPLLWVWSSDSVLSLEEFAERTIHFGVDGVDHYLPLGQATLLDIVGFFDLFANADNTICLESPAEIWPPPY